MNAIKLTKHSLRVQESRMQQLRKYLPTLQLKKALLQIETNQCSLDLEKAWEEYDKKYREIHQFSKLFSAPDMATLLASLQIDKATITYDNIAGLEIPVLQKVTFAAPDFSLFSTPFWWDSVQQHLQSLFYLKKRHTVLLKKHAILKNELRNVSIRVNLFEKILIPKTHHIIKKIQVFLGDQQLTSIAQSKVAKAKIMAKKVSLAPESL